MNSLSTRCTKVAFLCLFLILVSCATSSYKKLSVATPVTNQTYVDTSLFIMVLTPDVSYESVYNEKEVDNGQTKVVLQKNLEIRTLIALKNKGFRCNSTNQTDGRTSGFEKELSEIQNNSDLIFKAYPDEELKNKIQSFGSKTGITAIMVVDCDAKVGSGGSWNSQTGSITAKNDRTIVKAVLIKTSDCSKLWTNSVQLRELPTIGDNDFEKALNSLFTNLLPKI
jgi:hypothetical protein